MDDFSDHYIAAPNPPSHVAPRVVRLASIRFEFADDVTAAAREWEQLGFVVVGSGEAPLAWQDFPHRAAAAGASLIVQSAHPAPPHAVYLAAPTRAARDNAPHTRGGGSSAIELSDRAAAAPGRVGPMTWKALRIKLDMTDDLDAAVARWKRAGFVTLGWSDVGGKNATMGFTNPMCGLAANIGASLVVFRVTPAKVRSVRRRPDGRIDMDAVRANPPAGLFPGGYSVTQAVFLAPQSEAALAAAEALGALGSQDVPIALDE